MDMMLLIAIVATALQSTVGAYLGLSFPSLRQIQYKTKAQERIYYLLLYFVAIGTLFSIPYMLFGFGFDLVELTYGLGFPLESIGAYFGIMAWFLSVYCGLTFNRDWTIEMDKETTFFRITLPFGFVSAALLWSMLNNIR